MKFFVRYKVAAIVVAAWTLFPTPALAKNETATGNQLLQTCTDDGLSGEAFTCLAYIEGVVDSTQFYASLNLLNRTICAPKGVTLGQMQDIVIAYLRANPGTRHLPSVYLITLSMREAFPCSGQASK